MGIKKYFFVAFATLLALIYVACSKDEIGSKDKEPPTISDIKINWGDTLMVGVNQLIDNPGGRRPDTLIIGKSVRLSAIFEDDLALSSFSVKLAYDSINQSNADSTTTPYYYLSRGYSIFNLKIATMVQEVVIASIPETVSGKTTRAGDYFFTTYCMDLSGKVDSVQQIVRVITRDQWPRVK